MLFPVPDDVRAKDVHRLAESSFRARVSFLFSFEREIDEGLERCAFIAMVCGLNKRFSQ